MMLTNAHTYLALWRDKTRLNFRLKSDENWRTYHHRRDCDTPLRCFIVTAAAAVEAALSTLPACESCGVVVVVDFFVKPHSLSLSLLFLSLFHYFIQIMVKRNFPFQLLFLSYNYDTCWYDWPQVLNASNIITKWHQYILEIETFVSFRSFQIAELQFNCKQSHYKCCFCFLNWWTHTDQQNVSKL